MKQVITLAAITLSLSIFADTTNDLGTVAYDSQVSALQSSKADVTELEPIQTSVNTALAYSRGVYLYMNGSTNCYLSGTNYVIGAESTNRTHFVWTDGMDAATVPCSMALWEYRDGSKQCVWDQRDWTEWYYNFKTAQYRTEHDTRDAALRTEINTKSPKAWATHTACGITNVMAGTAWLDTPSVTLSAGYAYQHIADLNGTGYFVLKGNGFEIGGGDSTNTTLRITDWEGNEVLKIVKGGARMEYITTNETEAVGWEGNYMWVGIKTGTDATAPQPVGEFAVDLNDSFFEETSASCPAEVDRWSYTSNGVWRCYFRALPSLNATACFARFKVQTGTETTVEYTNAPTISGGLIYGGKKIAPVIPAGAAVGDTITWKVVQ